MQTWFWLFIAGGIGTWARFGASRWVQRLTGTDFPAGTLAVNLVGCALFGFLATWAESRAWLRPEARLWCLTGFLGAFTTFSTFAFETTSMLRDSAWLLAATNVVAHNGLGLLAIWLGIVCAQRL